MHRTPSRAALTVAALTLLLVPAVAVGDSGTFEDVPDDHLFASDIEWLAAEGVTKGCNPSQGNTNFCPEDQVTRGQMAAFMHRLANQVVDAKTALTAGDADLLDGKDSSEFVAMDEFDSTGDGIIDAAEIKIRHTIEDYNIDMFGAGSNAYVCPTASLTLETEATIVGSASLSLRAWTDHTGNDPYGYIVSSADGGATWDGFGLGFPNSFPPVVEDSMSISIDGVDTLSAGTYTFAIRIYALEDLHSGNDYYQLCGLTIQALTGQGAATDVVIVNNT
jgi:hypothetical protein